MKDNFKVWGSDNKVVIIENGVKYAMPDDGIEGLDISINGNNNNVLIEMPLNFVDCRLAVVGDGNTFVIKSSRKTRFLKVLFYVADGCMINIGRNCYINNNATFIAKEKPGTKIVIGDNCIISAECLLRCGDGHTLVNEYTGQPLNEPDDIILEDHVWVGVRSVLLKKTYLSQNTVVGAMSLVNKKFDIPNVLIGGVPAKIIKSGINWDLADYQSYFEE
ncbi:MAG: acyltransferase [Alphaproteobacteria bacterium]|nr:acyltransferase [Alphaproteobacteria bacterium]